MKLPETVTVGPCEKTKEKAFECSGHSPVVVNTVSLCLCQYQTVTAGKKQQHQDTGFLSFLVFRV